MMDYLKNTAGIDFTQIGDTIKNVKTVTDTGASGINSLKDLLQ